MPAILFGSISTLVDTSELQRAAFNSAFVEHGLGWTWDRDTYLSMLGSNGGADRIAAYATSRGETVDAAAVHATKSSIFQRELADADAVARPGVLETIRNAKDAGFKLGFVTTTSAANVDAVLDALAPDVSREDFDVVVDRSDVADPKPDPEAYVFALDALGEDAAACVAIEDNVGGVAAAEAAGLTCVAFPNENTAGHDFSAADEQVNRVDLAELRSFILAS